MTFTPPDQTTRKKRAFQGKIYHSLGKTFDAITGQEKIGYEYFQDGILVLDENGTIQACGEKNELEGKLDLSGCSITVLPDSQMILPGLIDLHVHLPQLNATARQEDDLLNWLERHIFAEEMKFSDAAYARQVSDLFFKSLLSNGTTTACVFLTSHKEATEIAFESAKAWGNRAVMGLNLMDRNAPKALAPPVNTLMTDTEALCQKWHGAAEGRLQYAWMPRFALSCSEFLLSGIGKLRRQYPEVYLHTHISEQLNEIDAVKQSFPWAKHYTDVYAHYGLLGPRTILAHGVYLEDIELDCLVKHEAGVAHCPSSNFFLKSGRFPWVRLVEKNVRFGLGSDVGAGPELSIFRTMRDAQFMQAEQLLAVHDLFYRATLGAADVLHLADRIGNLVQGKQADFIIVDLAVKQAVPDPNLPLGTALAQLAYTGDDRVVVKTFVSGYEVYACD